MAFPAAFLDELTARNPKQYAPNPEQVRLYSLPCVIGELKEIYGLLTKNKMGNRKG